MKFSIVIPQLFYDAIARVVPGAVVLVLVEAYGIIHAVHTPSSPELTGILGTLGHGVELIFIAYIIGWILRGMTWLSREPKHVTTETPNAKDCESSREILSLRSQYQWIRLANPEAGFRIVKLRAEARMLEAIRTAFTLSILASLILFFVKWVRPGGFIVEVSVCRLVTLLLISLLAVLVTFFRLEQKSWDNYKGNIARIYQLLHDAENPIPIASYTKWPPTNDKE